MVGSLPTESHAFVLSIFESGVLGRGRLSAAVRLEYFCLSPLIILDHLFTDQRVEENLRIAVSNFTTQEISSVVDLVVTNYQRPELLAEQMRHVDCFCNGYVVSWDTLKWKNSVVRTFVETVCDRAEITLPESARPLIIRTELDSVIKAFFDGTIEPQEIFRIVSRITKDIDEYRIAIQHTGAKSNVIARYLSEMRQFLFERNPEASEYTPACATPFNTALHEMASGKATLISSKASVTAFGKIIAEDRHLAIHFHQGSKIPERGEMLLFRFRRQCFLYNRHFSSDQRAEMTVILQREARGKCFFTYKREAVNRFLEEEFEWVPVDVVESENLARENDLSPTISSFGHHLVGGNSCRRARNFVNFSFPSQVVIRHLDIEVSILYNFCVKASNLGGRDLRDEMDRQAKERETKGANSGKQRSRR